MLVIGSVMGVKKTATFGGIIVISLLRRDDSGGDGWLNFPWEDES